MQIDHQLLQTQKNGFENESSISHIKMSDSCKQLLVSNGAAREDICLIDISSDKRWICHVSQCGDTKDSFTSTLSLRKLQYPPTSESSATQNTLHLKINLEPDIKSICIKRYFSAFNTVPKFLSISPTGQYIALSSYDKKERDTYASCIVFVVDEKGISSHCKIRSNGRAVFINRGHKVCLAIVNTKSLRIYKDIRNFSENMSYELRNLSPFKPTSLYGLKFPSFDLVHNYFIPTGETEQNSTNVLYIIATSDFIQNDILLTPLDPKSGLVSFWSLKANGVKIGSIFAPKERVIAFSKDSKYVATVLDDRLTYRSIYVVKVYNLENGCFVYALSSKMNICEIIHATFCCNSRYLAVAAIQQAPSRNLKGTKAVFEVWNIVEQKSIYATTKGLQKTAVGIVNPDPNRIKTLKLLILEEKLEEISTNLKGFYIHSSTEGTSFTTKFFELNINNQQETIIDWLASDELYPGRSIEKYTYSFYVKVRRGDRATIPHVTFDQLLNVYFSIDSNDFSEPLNPRYYFREKSSRACFGHDKFLARCGFIYSGKNKFLIRCGFYMIQLWKKIGNSDLQDENMQNYQLIYIKPYMNTNCRSCYLSPNIWRIESFEKLKISSTPTTPRVVVNIVEDEQYLRPNKKKSLSCREEFILPLEGDDNAFDYRKFEGACQTLYFLNIFCIEGKEKAKEDLRMKLNFFFEETTELIKREIASIDKSCSSFKTIDGSKTLAMLASFRRGRDILKLLLKNETVYFNIFDYSVTTAYGAGTINLSEESRYDTVEYKYEFEGKIDNTSAIQPSSSEMKESVLTVLIREREYHLYHLFLNRILSDSVNAGPECLLVLNEVLILLQQLGNIDHYQKSCQKLSYLRIGDGVVLPTEIPHEISQKADFQDDLIANIRNIFIFSTLEEIRKVPFYRKKYDDQILKSLICMLLRAARITWVSWKCFWKCFFDVFRHSQKKPSNQFVTCVVPLTYFNTYYHTNVLDAIINFSYSQDKKNNSVKMCTKKESLFLQLASNQYSEPNIWKQGDDVMAILLQYKWRAFIRKRFFLVCIIHVVYYVSYCTGVQFAFEMYGYDSTGEHRSTIADGRHITSLILFFFSASILLALELLQIFKNKKSTHYFKSWYNYVDIAAITLPLITFLQMLLNWKLFYEVSSVCALTLWLHGIVRLRVFSSFGITLEIILQLFKKVKSVLFILLIVVFGFTHSFIALLRQQEDQYFQENYSGESSLHDQASTMGNTSLYDVSSSNGFNDSFKAFYQVWLFIFGVWDPVTAGDAGDNRMLFALCIIFAFITVLIFTNMIIALMSSTVDEVKQQGKRVWMTHFAAVIAEIESLTFTSTRYDRENNPAFIFYAGNAEKVKLQEDKLRQETRELRRALMIDEDEYMKAADDLKSNGHVNYEKSEMSMKEMKAEIKSMKDEIQVIKDSIQNTNVHLQKIYNLMASSHGNES